jgi:pimeloyl-ACP methyl ester carboxylesterase
MTTQYLIHNRIRLALHELTAGDGVTRPLLLLHGLGECSPAAPPVWAQQWSGAIHALDFTGHGASTVPAGGGYSAELLLGDADAALTALGEATVVGRGLGAYIALMLAGARPHAVHGAVLADGPGLAGGNAGPTSHNIAHLAPRPTAPDPYALMELSRDPRPADYATSYVRLAVDGAVVDEPLAVSAKVRPLWLAAVVEEPGVFTSTMTEALVAFGQA